MAQAKIIETGSDVIMAVAETISMPCPTPGHGAVANIAAAITFTANLLFHFA